jgi:hypothetical protein
MCGPRESHRYRFRITIVEIHYLIVRNIVIEQGRARRDGGARLGHSGQRVNVQHHRLSRVAGLFRSLRHHDGHRIPDETYLVSRHHRLGWHTRGTAIPVLLGDRNRHGAEPRRLQVAASVDRQHAGHCGGLRRVDPVQGAMAVGATNHHPIDLTGKG